MFTQQKDFRPPLLWRPERPSLIWILAETAVRWTSWWGEPAVTSLSVSISIRCCGSSADLLLWFISKPSHNRQLIYLSSVARNNTRHSITNTSNRDCTVTMDYGSLWGEGNCFEGNVMLKKSVCCIYTRFYYNIERWKLLQQAEVSPNFCILNYRFQQFLRGLQMFPSEIYSAVHRFTPPVNFSTFCWN